jgi:uncharacterized Zn finger protein
MSWSEKWIDALASGAGLDESRLSRGRTLSKIDSVGTIEVEPGLLRAEIDSTRPYVAIIGVAALPDAEWADLLDLVTERASLSAALLSGELPFDLADRILPTKGDVSCDCTCADGAEPCVHAASLLHAAGELFDVEPFALLLIRGRGRNDILTELRARRAASLGIVQPEGSDLPRGADTGTSAADAWRREPEPLTSSPRVPRQPGTLVTLAAPPPSDSGISERELRLLVEDAAARAHAVLTGDGDTALALGAGADVVRRAASGDIAAISEATKVPLDELTSAAQAWQFGGASGLRVSRRKWEPDTAALVPGQAALGPNARVRGNTVSLQRSQLRLDEDGRWWLFTADDELGWVLASEPADNPEDLV